MGGAGAHHGWQPVHYSQLEKISEGRFMAEIGKVKQKLPR
jgi:hypothetical protein